ncbi:LPS export ABC transporter periplasmic protein LptC [Leisingera thetidis]|uniref:LPS export ABC transporter periplasmic protein LptC n=1 Tax=Leisingera thetidis TaxID=2930199 RepID=UPI0021F7DCFC|nr:LPS export ABC transporter periplasmic protein LptC [Leisingera thetidis]
MDSHSRAVAYLKVLLPLTALVLLSTLFLISRGVDTEAVIPFAQKEIEDRMKGQQVTAPFFSGTTAQGDEIMVTAALARPGGNGAPAVASSLSADFKLAQGGRITLASETGAIYPGQDMARFTGSVTITSADGLVVETEELNTALSGLEADSPGPVRATGAIGELTAGNMRIGVKTEGGPVHMLFKNGVKLLYDPQQPER